MLFCAPRDATSIELAGADHSSRRNALHVCVLANLALAQPAYDRLGKQSAYLFDLGVRPPSIFLFMAALALGLPAAIFLFQCVAGLCGRRMRDAVHGIAIYLLLMLLTLPVLKRATFLPAEVVFGGALIVAAIAVWSYFEFSSVRAFVSCCAIGLLAAPVSFFFSPTITSTLFPPQSLQPGHWNPVSTVIVVFDEVCGASLMNVDREIDPDRFPHLAELSRQSTWFRNAASVHPCTDQAVPAILSGRYPTTAWTPSPSDRPQNLFSVLEMAAGYDVALFEPVTHMTPRGHGTGTTDRPGAWRHAAQLLATLSRVFLFHVTPQDYHEYLPQVPDQWYGMRGSSDVDRDMRRGVFRYGWDDPRHAQFEHFLDCLTDTSRPTLYFMHALVPHVPWSYLPSGRRYTGDFDTLDLMTLRGHGGFVNLWGHDELHVIQCQQRYLLQLSFVDRLVGKTIERLKEAGLYDQCLLVVTADHGVSFRPDLPRRVIASETLGDILSVPLFIKRPHQTSGEISDRFVESVDILPTIADVLGIELSDPTDGRSVFDEAQGERRALTFIQNYTRVTADPAVVATSDVPRQIRERFGEARDPGAFFRIGPAPELVGRPVAALTRAAGPAPRVEWIRFGNVADESVDAIVPSFFEGRVLTREPADRPTVVAIAVNGIIQSVTRTHRLDGFRDRFAAMVPESSFHPGKNDVQIFVVTGEDPDWQLVPCTARGAGF
jgi:hypothetical protein